MKSIFFVGIVFLLSVFTSQGMVSVKPKIKAKPHPVFTRVKSCDFPTKRNPQTNQVELDVAQIDKNELIHVAAWAKRLPNLEK